MARMYVCTHNPGEAAKSMAPWCDYMWRECTLMYKEDANTTPSKMYMHIHARTDHAYVQRSMQEETGNMQESRSEQACMCTHMYVQAIWPCMHKLSMCVESTSKAMYKSSSTTSTPSHDQVLRRTTTTLLRKSKAIQATRTMQVRL
jgi:uncharacterized protein (UPF0128 family)